MLTMLTLHWLADVSWEYENIIIVRPAQSANRYPSLTRERLRKRIRDDGGGSD